MTRSIHEQTLRDLVVTKLREARPDARIVHELNVATGANRIDVAAVTHEEVIGIEIKSKADTLKRLSDQVKAFKKCCHIVLVCADAKHFEADNTLKHEEFRGKRWNAPTTVWNGDYPHMWEVRKPGLGQPRAANLLDLLWAEELRHEAGLHGVNAGSRSTRSQMIAAMAWNMTGQEIAQSVCRQLRARVFAEADEPILLPRLPTLREDLF